MTQREVEIEEPQQKELFEIGTIGTIKQVIKLPKKILRILVVGEERAMLRNIECGEPYMRALVEVEREEKKELPEEEGIQEQDPQTEALVRNLKEMFAELGVKSPKVSKEDRCTDFLILTLPKSWSDRFVQIFRFLIGNFRN